MGGCMRKKRSDVRSLPRGGKMEKLAYIVLVGIFGKNLAG